MLRAMGNAMEYEEFEQAIIQIREALDAPTLLSHFRLQQVYEEPWHSDFQTHLYAPVTYIAREQPERMGEELNRTVESLAAHCEERLRTQDNPEREIETFHERIRQTPIIWAADRLTKNIVPGLQYIGEQHFRASSLPRGLTGSPPYALRVLAESETALAQFRDEGENETRQRNREAIRTIRDYTVSYYVERAPVEQATRLLFDYENGFLPEAGGTYPTPVMEYIAEVREAIAAGNGDETRQGQIASRLSRFREALEAAQYITQHQPERLRHMAEVLVEVSSDFSRTTVEALADATRYVSDRYISPRDVAAFRLIEQDLETGGELASDAVLKQAFQTMNQFITDFIATQPRYGNSPFATEVAEEQKTLRDIWSAATVEAHVAGMEGVREAMAVAVKERHVYRRLDYNKVLDWITALSNFHTDNAGLIVHVSAVDQWGRQQIITYGIEQVGYALIEIEERVGRTGETALSNNAQTALQQVNDATYAHYVEYNQRYRQDATPEPERSVIACRARIAAKPLKELPGLEQLEDFIGEFERAKYDTPRQSTDPFEKHFLSTAWQEKVPEAGRYKAILQEIVERGGEHAEAAEEVIRYFEQFFEPSTRVVHYINQYFDSAQQGAALDLQAERFLPAWRTAVKYDAQTEIMQALNGNAHAAAFFLELGGVRDNPATLYVAEFYEMGEVLPFAELVARMLSRTHNPPLTQMREIARIHHGLGNIVEIVPAILENPESARWDVAKWLLDADKALQYSFDARRLELPVNGVRAYLDHVYLEGSRDDIAPLKEEMRAGLEAIDRFDPNNHILKQLCTDTPEIKEPGTGINLGHDASIAGCALLTVRLEQEIAQEGRQKDRAEKALPFWNKAVAHAGVGEAVSEQCEKILRMLEAGEQMAFLDNDAIIDKGNLLGSIELGGYGAARIVAVLDDVLHQNREGTYPLEGEQIRRLETLRVQTQEWVNACDGREGFDKHITAARSEVGFSHIMAARQEIPELDSVVTHTGETVGELTFYEVMHPPLGDERIPYVAEQVLIAVQDALAGNYDIASGLRRSLLAVEAHIIAEFRDNDAYLEQEGSRGYPTHAETVERIRQQRQGWEMGG